MKNEKRKCAVRETLDEMVSWWIGIKHNFQVSKGKMGKYFKRYLSEEYWEMYKVTYSDGTYDNFWDSIFAACDLFRTLAKDVAACFNYTYAVDDDINMTGYLKHVRELPENAKEIY